MATLIFKTYRDFINREDKTVNGVSETFAESHPNFEVMNKTNIGYWNCSDCFDCLDCSDCFRYFNCLDCSDCYRCSDFSR